MHHPCFHLFSFGCGNYSILFPERFGAQGVFACELFGDAVQVFYIVLRSRAFCIFSQVVEPPPFVISGMVLHTFVKCVVFRSYFRLRLLLRQVSINISPFWVILPRPCRPIAFSRCVLSGPSCALKSPISIVISPRCVEAMVEFSWL